MADLVAHCEATQFAGAVTCSHGALGSDETGSDKNRSDEMRRMIWTLVKKRLGIWHVLRRDLAVLPDSHACIHPCNEAYTEALLPVKQHHPSLASILIFRLAEGTL